jgi:poly(3-hydroxybutyrate) depolymerase
VVTLLLEEEEKNNNYNSIGILPLVFGIHCYGCTAINLSIFIKHANSHNMILVLPEGLQQSFNAIECCGYAKTQNINDVSFFTYIQQTLNLEYPSIIQSQYSYAVGWSNGGFMVMVASSLFRAIAPIAGYISVADIGIVPDYYHTNSNNSSTLSSTLSSEGKPTINSSSNSNGKGLFIHHGTNDPVVRPTGCCHDPTLPQCCCDIAAETCVSVMDVARNWASMINGCSVVDEDFPSLVLTSITNNKATDANMVIDNEGRVGVECYTAMGVECLSNTTICMHNTAGHFNTPSFNDAFPMANEVMDFFARDACEVYHGQWNGADNGGCICPANKRGMFCLDDASPSTSDSETIKTISTSLSGEVGQEMMNVEHYGSRILLFVIGFVLSFVYLYVRNHKRSLTKRKRSSMTNDSMEQEEMELVRSSNFT